MLRASLNRSLAMSYSHMGTPTRFPPSGATAFHFWAPRQYVRMESGWATVQCYFLRQIAKSPQLLGDN